MRLVGIEPRPENESVEPMLLLDVTIAYPMGQKVPLDLLVTVRAGNKVLGTARPNTTGLGMMTLEAAAEGRNSNALEQTHTRQVVLPLSARLLDFLEDVRTTDRKKDVILQCDVDVRTLVSRTVNSHVQPGPEIADEKGKRARAVIYDYQPDSFHPQYTNMWILSGSGGRAFLQCEGQRFQQTITIRASDWVHEYLERWRMTKYVVIELPQPEVLTATSHVEERVNAAIEAIKRASESLTKGDWNEVLEDLRPVWELIKNQADIEKLLTNDGYIDEAAKAFNESIKQQFNLASKFMHRLGLDKAILPEMRAFKEDAYLCYSFALSALNLITRKMRRQSKGSFSA
jgi:hypothetical protein